MSQGKFSNPRSNRPSDTDRFPPQEPDDFPPRDSDQFPSQDSDRFPPQEPEGLADASGNSPDGLSDLFPEAESTQTEPREEPALRNGDPSPAPEGEPVFEDEYEDRDFLDTVMDTAHRVLSFCKQNQKIVMTAACAVVLVLILVVMAAIFAGSSDEYDGRILNNVLLGDINVGGMTKNEAIAALREATTDVYASEYMVIDLSGTTLRLSPSDVSATLDVKAAVNAAYDYGRTGTQAEREKAYQDSLTGNHIIGLLPYLELNESYIMDVLETYAKEASSTLTQASYELDGVQPELATDKFDPDAPCQTLIITTGVPGVSFDVDGVFNMVLDAYSLCQFLVTVDDVTPVADPDPVDLQAIYDAVCIEPVNATVNMSTYEAVPGSYGYVFDMEAAQAKVYQAQYGEQVFIDMEYVEPEILESEVFCQDVLGEVQTAHANGENRTTNLRLACEAINGLVLNPGDTFSFNETLGERTTQKGYRPAPAYSGTQLVDSVGGGICQVSSTLYHCTLLADLATVSRTNHSLPVSYTEYGLDATVSWGSTDFQFRNSTNFPIRIEAEVVDEYVKVRILGTDQRSYYVKMESSITTAYTPDTEYEDFPYDNAEGYKDGDVIRTGVTGYLVKTYKLKYDKESNKLISRDYETSSRYATVNKLVARVEQEPTETTEPTVPETTPPTVPETTPPTVPETTPPTVPETTPPTVPETTVPTVPETTVPTVPETTVPETTVPETAAPTMPQTTPTSPAQEESTS